MQKVDPAEYRIMNRRSFSPWLKNPKPYYSHYLSIYHINYIIQNWKIVFPGYKQKNDFYMKTLIYNTHSKQVDLRNIHQHLSVLRSLHDHHHLLCQVTGVQQKFIEYHWAKIQRSLTKILSLYVYQKYILRIFLCL